VMERVRRDSRLPRDEDDAEIAVAAAVGDGAAGQCRAGCSGRRLKLDASVPVIATDSMVRRGLRKIPNCTAVAVVGVQQVAMRN